MSEISGVYWAELKPRGFKRKGLTFVRENEFFFQTFKLYRLRGSGSPSMGAYHQELTVEFKGDSKPVLATFLPTFGLDIDPTLECPLEGQATDEFWSYLSVQASLVGTVLDRLFDLDEFRDYLQKSGYFVHLIDFLELVGDVQSINEFVRSDLTTPYSSVRSFGSWTGELAVMVSNKFVDALERATVSPSAEFIRFLTLAEVEARKIDEASATRIRQTLAQYESSLD
jgi:hypothetical protein